MTIRFSIILLLFLMGGMTSAQDSMQTATAESKSVFDELTKIIDKNYRGKLYTIDSIVVKGSELISDKLIISFSGLKEGMKMLYPGSDNIARAIRSLYQKKIFSDVRIFATNIVDDKMSLLIEVKDRATLTGYSIVGVSKSQKKELDTKLALVVGRPITQSMIDNAVANIKSYFKEKGYNLTEVNPQISSSVSSNGKESKAIKFFITKGRKVRIYDINFWGNQEVSPYSLAKKMKDTRKKTRFTLYPRQNFNPMYGQKQNIRFKDYITNWGFLSFSKTVKFIEPYVYLNIFNPSKFDPVKYDEDKIKLIDYYNELGFRDARIVRDSLYMITDRLLNIDIEVEEGSKYYFGNITWSGNTKFSDTLLSAVLGIQKGQPYNRLMLEKHLGTSQSQDGKPIADVMSLYMDDGHLFFRVQPVETRVYNDTIDFDMRIVEGPPATINDIKILGNTITNERVIRRSLRILPGQKFSRSALIRSVRELATLGFFNPETISPQPKPNLENGTVDIILGVEEKSNDQVEASVSYGGFVGVTGSIGFVFKNFSLRQLFKPEGVRQFIPRGDAQTLSIKTQFNGPQYQSVSLGFTEPWLGNTYRRTSFSLGLNYSNYSPGGLLALSNSALANDSRIETISASVSFGTQLRWPDDYFIFKYGVSYTHYSLTDYRLFTGTTSGDGSSFDNGTSDNISFQLGLSRSSVDNPTFARSGSNFSFNLGFTLPYSLIDRSLEIQSSSNQLKLTEYYKIGYNAEWYLPLSAPHGPERNKQLMLKIQTKGGYLGRYNPNVPYTPFERFQLGDAGLVSRGGFLGYDVISQRGYFVYDNSDLTINPEQTSTSNFFTIYNKYLFELRYPLTFSQSATIYITSYFEAANGWYRIEEYNPFQLRKSLGVGIRFFLPIFGLLGFDYAIGIDRLNENSSSIFEAGKFSFILGFEPQ